AENIKFYTYKELRSATDNFNQHNKIGEGGFGSVELFDDFMSGCRTCSFLYAMEPKDSLFFGSEYDVIKQIVLVKGKLRDGTIVAIKVLSPESRQGLEEFLTELTVLADIEHENLVEMLGKKDNTINFSWPIRRRICIGIARGLTFLHEEVEPHIIHRDIKASNILLDKDLTAKLSDFGLAKLIPSNMTHVSTKVAGTLGYLAPEYALCGQLTRKADIYSFGVLLMEVVCGRCNRNRRLPRAEQYLLQRAWAMLEKEALVELVDEAFRGDLDIEEANRFLKIALLCTQQSPNLRPDMSIVVKMLQGEEDASDTSITAPGAWNGGQEVKATAIAKRIQSKIRIGEWVQTVQLYECGNSEDSPRAIEGCTDRSDIVEH
ncbi:hypothetical protein KSS87_001721, partial [Heliosperma pusillum]